MKRNLKLIFNLVIIAVFYVFLAAGVSYLLTKIFPTFDTEWQQRPNWQQVLDVASEISVIVLISFWLTYFVEIWFSILPVNMFVYAVFIFMGTLDDKLRHLFVDIFGA